MEKIFGDPPFMNSSLRKICETFVNFFVNTEPWYQMLVGYWSQHSHTMDQIVNNARSKLNVYIWVLLLGLFWWEKLALFIPFVCFVPMGRIFLGEGKHMLPSKEPEQRDLLADKVRYYFIHSGAPLQTGLFLNLG